MPRPPSKEPRVRLNLEITVQLRDRICRIRDLTEADSTTEVIRQATRVYEKLLTLDGDLVVRMPDGSERSLLIV